jgi:membrane peptidoglycan carboxypeptidase
VHRIQWRPYPVLIAVGLCLFLLGLGISWTSGLLAPATAQPAPAPSILISDRQGRLLLEVIDPNGSKNVPLSLADIPLACQQATIATEDRRFYSHPGVDFLAILRAAWGNWRRVFSEDPSVVAFSGASTLTQQLARNLYLPPEQRYERSLWRKLREAWLAWRLERQHSKDEILALYLNNTYYGHFATGIEAAAEAYFGVHARDLDLAQCSLLAGLPQNPAAYNPIEAPDAARHRQGVVLELMTRDSYITLEQATEALGERLAYASTPFPIYAPHFVMWVQGQVEETVGPDVVRQGGLRVTTTLDLDVQRRAEEIIRRRLAMLRPCASLNDGSGVCDPYADASRRVDNAALVALEPDTGAILAMVGSPDYFDVAISGAVNGALSARQPGSAIKPITYALALDPKRAAEEGQSPWTAATLIADLRTVFPTREGRPYVPQNYDLTFHGPVTVRSALANSYNIPAVKALQYIGVDSLVKQASRMGIDWMPGAERPDLTDQVRAPGAAAWKLDTGSWNLQAEPAGQGPGDEVLQWTEAGEIGMEDPAIGSASGYGLALTLGGGEVRLLDLTAAFGAFANGGVRVQPYGIQRIETLDGETLFSAESRPPPERVVDERVAYLITDILSDVAARRPEFGAGNFLEIGRPAAAKTGTTTDWRDNWTIGYVPQVAAGVWVGNADNTPMRDVSGITGAGPIWHDFMSDLLRDEPTEAFSVPDGLQQIEVCADSGLLPGDPEAHQAQPSIVANALGNSDSARRSSAAPSVVVPCPYRRLEWFIDGTDPTRVDTDHQQVAIDVRTGRRANASTPAEAIREQTFWVLPGEYLSWARENGFPQPPEAPPAIAEAAPTGAMADGTAAGEEVQGNPAQIRLTSPDGNRVYRIDPRLPANVQRIAVTAAPGAAFGSSGVKVTLLVDGAPLAQVVGPDYTAWWQLQAGRHSFQAVAMGPGGETARSAAVTVLIE